MTNKLWPQQLRIFATILAFVVVVLGAYTRLSDSGLGCPDWPGCYGEWVVPSDVNGIKIAQAKFPQIRLESVKAWIEMSHRYLAGGLGLLVLILCLEAWLGDNNKTYRWVCLGLLGLIIFQAALGMWTVTLKLLPVVVMGHLLGGFSTFCLLGILTIKQGFALETSFTKVSKLVMGLGYLSFVLYCWQIVLGGWTSANYVALACLDFPTCHGQWLPKLDLKSAFSIYLDPNVTKDFNHLSLDAKVTIQYMHRLGALLCTFALFGLGFKLRQIFKPRERFWVYSMCLLLSVQLCLGIANVMLRLPVLNAVMHNGVAALLLLNLSYLIIHMRVK